MLQKSTSVLDLSAAREKDSVSLTWFLSLLVPGTTSHARATSSVFSLYNVAAVADRTVTGWEARCSDWNSQIFRDERICLQHLQGGNCVVLGDVGELLSMCVFHIGVMKGKTSTADDSY